MARIIVHNGKKKVVVKIQYALDRDDLIFAVLEDGISQGIRPKSRRQCLEIARQYFYRNGIRSGPSLADDTYQKYRPDAVAIVDKFFPELKE
jgi:hypothetical protein